MAERPRPLRLRGGRGPAPQRCLEAATVAPTSPRGQVHLGRPCSELLASGARDELVDGDPFAPGRLTDAVVKRLREALPSPDPVRLRYRNELAEIARETVRGGGAVDAREVRGRGRQLVPAADLDAVVAMALNELHRLREGNIARFGLRLGAFRACFLVTSSRSARLGGQGR